MVGVMRLWSSTDQLLLESLMCDVHRLLSSQVAWQKLNHEEGVHTVCNL